MIYNSRARKSVREASVGFALMLIAVFALQFFSMTMSINDKQKKENRSTDEQNDDYGFVMPNIFHKAGQIGNHLANLHHII
jgi:hypothetical protein